MKKKMDYKTIVIAMLGVVLVAIAVLFFVSKKENEKKEAAYIEQLGDRDFEISVLNDELDALSTTVTVYRTKKDIKSGNLCEADDLEQVEVPEAMAEGYNVELEDIVGKYYFTDMSKGETVYKQSVYYVPLKKDDRYLDILCDREPIGFKKGDTVDIRVSCPDGQDYLLLEGKLVHAVYGNVVNILADEKDIIIYKGMEADWCRFWKGAEVGTAMMVYAVSHVQGALQQGGERYYPIANVLPDGVTFEGSTMWTALHDLNLSEAELSDWERADRKTFEKSLEMYDQYRRVDYTYIVRLVLQDAYAKVLQDMETKALTKFNETGETTDYVLDAMTYYDAMYRATSEIAGAYSNIDAKAAATELGMYIGEKEVAVVYQCSEDEDYTKKLETNYTGTSVGGAVVYDKTIAVDMIRGAQAVAQAKEYRDDIYKAAAVAYAEQQEKIRAAKAAAELEGLPFDEETWEYTYALYQQKMGQKDEATIVEEDGIVR